MKSFDGLFKGEKFLTEAREQLKNYQAHSRSIDAILVDAGLPKLSECEPEQKPIAMFLKSDKDPRSLAIQLTCLINDSDKICTILKAQIDDADTLHKREMEKRDREKANERWHMWVLWIQKTARWALGSIAAVLLYSAVVSFEKPNGFIKVPVKDWFSPAPVD